MALLTRVHRLRHQVCPRHASTSRVGRIVLAGGAAIGVLVFPAIAFVVTIPAIILGFVACSRWETAAGTITEPSVSSITLLVILLHPS